MGHQDVCDIGITLQDSHIPVLTEVLGDCTHKWEELVRNADLVLVIQSDCTKF